MTSTPAPPTQPTGSTLQSLAERAWERVGRESVLHFEDQRWTAEQLGERARRLAAGLISIGLRPGDRVAVCMANCPEVGVTYNATWWAGAATTPTLFLLSESELAHVLRDSEAAFAVTTPEFLPKVAAAGKGVDTLRGIIVAGGTPDASVFDLAELESGTEAPRADRDPGSLAALLYTGGTTGRSKGVMLSHDALSAAAWAATNTSREEALSTALLPLPLSHVYGLMVNVMGLHAAVPRTAVLMRWFDPAGWLRLAEQHQVQISAVVPSMLHLLLEQPLEDYDLSALRRIASGGASLPREVATEFQRRLPQVEVSEGYGCTETAAIIATQPVGAVRAGSVGVAAAGVEVRVERPDGTEADPGEDGEICVRGAMLMTGYWHAEAETAEAMRGGWLHTGDIGHRDADGYLYIVDRIKDLIIRDGFNVYPKDVEEAMLTHPDVTMAGVVGRPDRRHGEEVVAFVQLRPGAAVTAEELVAHAKSRIAAVKYPREVRVVEALPLTAVGKLDRKLLRAQVRT